MKQKMYNMCLSISNVLVMLILFLYMQVIIGLEPELIVYTKIPISDKWNLLAIHYTILICIMFVFNLICVILNMKNKKLASWYTITTVNYLMAGIALITRRKEYFNDYFMYSIFIIYAIIGIINFIIDVKKHNIKVWKIIVYILAVIALVCAVLFKSIVVILVMTCVMQLCNNTETKKDGLIKKIINIIMFLIVISIIVYISINLVYLRIEWKKINDETVEFIEKVKTGILSEELKEEEILIPVKKNGKIGFINRNGKMIIDCEYDAIPANIVNEVRCIILKKGNVYYTLTKKGKVINSLEENPLPFFKGKTIEGNFNKENDSGFQYVDKEFSREAMKLYLATTMLNLNLDFINNKSENSDVTNDNSISDRIEELYKDVFLNSKDLEAEDYYYEGENRIYEFLLDNGNLLKVEEIIIDMDEEKNICTAEFNLFVFENDKLINQYQNIKIPWVMYIDNTMREIDSFKNGYVPYCNLENKVSGIFYKNNFEKAFEIKGDFQILEVIDENKILLRDYSDTNNIKKIIMDKQGNVLLSCKEIEITENGGYIIKKDNNKYSYLNNDFKEITQEYDIMMEYNGNLDGNEEVKDLLICGRKNEDIKLGLITKDGEIISQIEYDGIGFEIITYTKEYLEDYIDKDKTKLYTENDFLLDEIYFHYYNIPKDNK